MKRTGLERGLTRIAHKVSESNVNSACLMFLYQPSISKEMMNKLKKHL